MAMTCANGLEISKLSEHSTLVVVELTNESNAIEIMCKAITTKQITEIKLFKAVLELVIFWIIQSKWLDVFSFPRDFTFF